MVMILVNLGTESRIFSVFMLIMVKFEILVTVLGKRDIYERFK